MKTRIAAFICATLLVSLLVPAIQTSASTEDPSAATQQLLNQRVQAIQTDNKNEFLSTIDPDAPQSFKDAQANVFDGMHSLPIVDYSLAIRTATSGDLAPGLGIAAKYHAQDAFLPETRETYMFSGYDDRPAVNSYWYSYVERNGNWYIASDDDASVIGLESAHNIWDLGTLAVKQTPHFLIITPVANAARGEQLAPIAEAAMERFQSTWPYQWSGKVPLIVPPTTTELDDILQTQLQTSQYVTFTSYTPIRDNGWTTTAPRIYTVEATLDSAAADQQTAAVLHELAHVFNSSQEGPFTPVWLHEGIATWIQLGKPTTYAAPSGTTELPTDADFASPNSEVLGNAFQAATSAIAFIAKTKGIDAPEALFSALGARRLNIGSPAFNLDQAMQQTLGMTTQQFDAQWLGQ